MRLLICIVRFFYNWRVFHYIRENNETVTLCPLFLVQKYIKRMNSQNNTLKALFFPLTHNLVYL